MDSPRRAGRRSSTRGPSVPKDKLAGTIAILAFGLTALFAVLNAETLVGVTFVLGFFVLLPLVGILGDDLPYVSEGDDESTDETQRTENPVARLRERYARGDIDEAEFERRLDALLETEDLEGVVDGDASAKPDRDRETELE